MLGVQFHDGKGLALGVAVARAIAPEERGAFGADFDEFGGEFRGVGDLDERGFAATEELGDDKTDASFHVGDWKNLGGAADGAGGAAE